MQQARRLMGANRLFGLVARTTRLPISPDCCLDGRCSSLTHSQVGFKKKGKRRKDFRYTFCENIWEARKIGYTLNHYRVQPCLHSESLMSTFPFGPLIGHGHRGTRSPRRVYPTLKCSQKYFSFVGRSPSCKAHWFAKSRAATVDGAEP